MSLQSKAVEDLVGQIVEAVHPIRVIVFGSAAREDTGPDSDIDLMVVMPDGTHRRHTAQALYRTVKNVGVPFDILVATPADLERHRNNVGLIYRTVLTEGREVYAA